MSEIRNAQQDSLQSTSIDLHSNAENQEKKKNHDQYNNQDPPYKDQKKKNGSSIFR